MTIFIILFVAACASQKKVEYCQLFPNQKNKAVKNVEAFIQSVTDENATYVVSPTLFQEGKLIHGKNGCYTYLMPKAIDPNSGVLNGRGWASILVSVLTHQKTFNNDSLHVTSVN